MFEKRKRPSNGNMQNCIKTNTNENDRENENDRYSVCQTRTIDVVDTNRCDIIESTLPICISSAQSQTARILLAPQYLVSTASTGGQSGLLTRILLAPFYLPFISSVNGFGLTTLASITFVPRIITQSILYPIFRLVFGTLYPAYASYKAVRNKDAKDYVSIIMN